MKLARTKNTIRNTAWGAIYRITTIIGPFAVKTLIVRQLGLEYSGLSSLFTSILTVLNLTNMGFSSSIVFTMYKAIVNDDIDTQCAMINFYRRVYRIVGLVILALGLALMPFLPHFVKGDCPSDINLYILFAIYLAETSMDYLMFAYVTAIFTAYQRNDITLKISTIRYIIQYSLQAIALLVVPNYYVYIIILPLMVIPNNIANYIASRREYPQLTCRGTLDKAIKKDIYLRVSTLFGHKVGSTVLVSVDSIIISAFLGLRMMGIYGNYYYILTAVNALVEIITNGALSGIGNKLITDTREENYKLFKTLSYGWMFLIGMAAACMLCLYQPFIAGIWYDSDYLLDTGIVVLIVIYFYSWMFRIMQLTYRDAAGLWTEDWLKPYVAMITNIVGSVWMVKVTGSVAGVLVPTIFVFFCIYFPWEAFVLFKKLFDEKLSSYIFASVKYTIISAGSCALSLFVCMQIAPANTAISFIIRLPIVVLIHCVLWGIITYRSDEFRSLSKRVIVITKKRL